jgi:hypothetical protein
MQAAIPAEQREQKLKQRSRPRAVMLLANKGNKKCRISYRAILFPAILYSLAQAFANKSAS